MAVPAAAAGATTDEGEGTGRKRGREGGEMTSDRGGKRCRTGAPPDGPTSPHSMTAPPRSTGGVTSGVGPSSSRGGAEWEREKEGERGRMMTVEYGVSVLVSHHSRVACSSPCGELKM